MMSFSFFHVVSSTHTLPSLRTFGDFRYATTLTLFRGWGVDAVANASNIVAPDALPLSFARYMAELLGVGIPTNATQADMFARFPMPWRGGCPLGPALARREVTLTPGRYTLVVRGDPYFDDRGGVYVVKLTCAGGAATRAATSSDPGGLSVDSVTGAITGTPQQEGDNFHMQLRAVDGARGAAVVAEWHFNVRDPIFSTAESWAGTPDASRGIVPRYHVGQFHTLRAPPLNKHQLFVLPANNNFDNIGEWDTLDSSLCVCVCVCVCVRARACVCVCVSTSAFGFYPRLKRFCRTCIRVFVWRT
jgi:hypothetical protein